MGSWAMERGFCYLYSIKEKASFTHGNTVEIVQLVDTSLILHDLEFIAVQDIDVVMVEKAVPDLTVLLIPDDTHNS